MAPVSRCCVLAAHASVRLSGAEAHARRRSPGPACGKLSPSLLKHADEQTVAGVSAVLHAIDAYRLAPEGPDVFRGWGVIGAARFIGRDVISRDVPDFRKEGPWGVSPHIIPHRSLHSPSGAVSVALNCMGPNYGTGGGAGFETEGLLSALSLLWGRHLPGVWLVVSRVDPPDADCDGSGGIPEGVVAEAVALALVPEGTGPRLCVESGQRHESGAELTFEGLRDLAQGGTWSVPGCNLRVMPGASVPMPTAQSLHPSGGMASGVSS